MLFTNLNYGLATYRKRFWFGLRVWFCYCFQCAKKMPWVPFFDRCHWWHHQVFCREGISVIMATLRVQHLFGILSIPWRIALHVRHLFFQSGSYPMVPGTLAYA
jgi:hypothetical protein